MERVVVTGMGAITPIGNDVETFWSSLKAGKCGIGPITKFDVTDFKVKVAAEVKDFDPASVVPVKQARWLDRYVLLGLAAAQEAVADASLDTSYDPMRVGILFGSAIGGIIGIMEQGDVLRERGGQQRAGQYGCNEFVHGYSSFSRGGLPS